jgi:ankyrin repeat protein
MNIHLAAKRGNKAEILRHIAAGTPVDEISQDGATPLIWAAGSEEADVSVLELLIDRGADVNAITAEWTRSPLTAARDQPKKMLYLLERGADPTRAEIGSRMVFPGVPMDLTRRFIELGVDPTADPDKCNSAMLQASMDCDWERIALFYEFGYGPDDLGWSPLMNTIVFGDVAELSSMLAFEGLLLERDPWDRTPFLLAVCVGDVTKASTLIAAGSRLDERGRCEIPALHYAARHGRLDMIRWLLLEGIEVNVTDEYRDTALHAACEFDQPGAVELLIAAGAKVNAENFTQTQPINQAESPEVVEKLLAGGADIDFEEGSGEFLLKQAAADGNERLVQYLIREGANVNKIGGDVGGALHAAVNADEDRIIQRLLAAGADPNLANEDDGWRPLWYARSREVAETLVNAGARLDLTDAFGLSALHGLGNDEVRDYLRSSNSISE